MTRTKTRTVRHGLWLTPEEKKRWGKKAASASLNLNEFIRLCVEKRKITPVPPEVNRTTAVELRKIGVNLNQIARAMNTAIASGQQISNVDEALTALNQILPLLQRLQLQLMSVSNAQQDGSASSES